MQDHDVTRPDLVWDERVSVLPALAEGILLRCIERGFSRFERSIRVPRGLDPDAIEASLSDGVLTLRIPKPETMRPRRIEIKGSANGAREHAGATA